MQSFTIVYKYIKIEKVEEDEARALRYYKLQGFRIHLSPDGMKEEQKNGL
jgi:hypothetical protein